MRKQWYTFRISVISFHVLAWIGLFLLPLLFQRDNHGHDEQQNHSLFTVVNLGLYFFWIFLFYFNAYFLIPKYLNKNRSWTYIIILLGIFIAFVIYTGFLFEQEKKAPDFSFRKLPFFMVFPFMFMWAISTVFRLVTDKIRMDQILKERENETLKTELSFLRSQVSPHFLFNVLNNMVALARLKSDRLEPSLIGLSGLMRYMLYESDEDKVRLSKEVEYVTSYIDLQRLRFGRDMPINVHIDLKDDYYSIEPMLLIPFIENAFKHGSGMIQNPEISVDLSTEKGLLKLQVRNRYNPEVVETRDKTSGIGLVNVTRRLDLLYDKRYSLVIDKSDGWFIVNLELKLQ